MLSFGRKGILIRTGPAIPTTCRALNFVDPLSDLLVIRNNRLLYLVTPLSPLLLKDLIPGVCEN